jgi:hypothetical protein
MTSQAIFLDQMNHTVPVADQQTAQSVSSIHLVAKQVVDLEIQALQLVREQ